MPRTRRSGVSELGAADDSNVSLPTDTASESGVRTRSSSAARKADPEPPRKNSRVRGLRGRPGRASVTATPVSSVTTPTNNYWSGSDYNTPVTSTLPTPIPPAPAEIDKDASVSRRNGNRIEVVIENAKPTADSARALRQSIYSMTSKRKRDTVEDTEDEDGGDSPDAVLARKLQDEEEQQAMNTWTPSSIKQPLRRSGRITLSSAQKPASPPYVMVSDNEDKSGEETDDDSSMVLPRSRSATKRTGPLAKPHTSRPGRSKNSSVISNSEDDEEDDDLYEDDNDSEDFVQVSAKRRKTGAQSLAKAAAKPPPKARRSTIPSRTRSKGQPAIASNSGNELTASFARDLIDVEAGKEKDDDDNDDDDDDDDLSDLCSAFASSPSSSSDSSDAEDSPNVDEHSRALRLATENRRAYRSYRNRKRVRKDRDRLEQHHPELLNMWHDLENMPVLKAGKAEQPKSISRMLKPFQLEGLAWMQAMEKTEWKGGLLGDEMGLGKTIQAVSLIMSDWPAKQPSLVLVPPVALMQWVSEIDSYTDGTLKTLVYHGTNSKSKNLTAKDLKKFDVIIMSYNSLESMFRKQEKGFKRKEGIYKEKSIIHQTQFHRVILDEAHSIKTRTTMTAKACFALKVEYRWCLTGTPLQNRIGEFFSLIRFLNIQPFSCYFCKQCPCSSLEWSMDDDSRCTSCGHAGMQHVSVFNQELLNPIQKYGNRGLGAEAFKKLRLMTDRIMLRRLKKDHTDSMELPVKEIFVDRQFFGEEENDFANSIMTNGQRNFDTYVAQGVLLNNYANIFGLIMQMRQVADHPDLILKKNSEGGQNIIVCCICDDVAEEAIRSRCRHDFCRSCAKSYLNAAEKPDCPQCHIPLSIDLEQPEIEQDEVLVKKSSIINRIKMENWTSSSKIELLVHELHKLRSDKASHKSIIFSQFTTMLQLIEWRLRRAGITTVMLDGSMTPAQRQASIDHFMKNVDVECFLVSLKAGGVALNLTEASRVFIVDPWWNPAAEWQSADRCHRIGQTRPCTITRLCIEDSVESRMVLLQEKKTNMINSTINSDDTAMDSLSPEDLQFLFRGN